MFGDDDQMMNLPRFWSPSTRQSITKFPYESHIRGLPVPYLSVLILL